MTSTSGSISGSGNNTFHWRQAHGGYERRGYSCPDHFTVNAAVNRHVVRMTATDLAEAVRENKPLYCTHCMQRVFVDLRRHVSYTTLFVITEELL